MPIYRVRWSEFLNESNVEANTPYFPSERGKEYPNPEETRRCLNYWRRRHYAGHPIIPHLRLPMENLVPFIEVQKDDEWVKAPVTYQPKLFP
ncbi:MAG: hypothetical protein GF368_00360 [Candidatus Aenigmarchaeota archaeon]|nr:hypothetical protein [Candidatus Aenigmarchaeota archaeon]